MIAHLIHHGFDWISCPECDSDNVDVIRHHTTLSQKDTWAETKCRDCLCEFTQTSRTIQPKEKSE